MKSFAKLFLLSTVFTGLVACQAPNASETANTDANNNTADASASVGVGVNVGGDASNTSETNTSGSTAASANGDLTIDMRGTTYTYAQIKSYFQCVAVNSPNTSFKSTASAAVKDMNEADATPDAGDDKDAYTNAASAIELTQNYSKAEGCKP